MRLIDADLLKSTEQTGKVFNCECDELYGILQLIDEQPTVEIPQWIPCSERLPNNSDSYLVLFSMKPQLSREWCEVIHFQHKSKKWKRLNNLVIAWMPLPQPYKGE